MLSVKAVYSQSEDKSTFTQWSHHPTPLSSLSAVTLLSSLKRKHLNIHVCEIQYIPVNGRSGAAPDTTDLSLKHKPERSAISSPVIKLSEDLMEMHEDDYISPHDSILTSSLCKVLFWTFLKSFHWSGAKLCLTESCRTLQTWVWPPHEDS